MVEDERDCAGRSRSDWQASVSFDPTAEVIEYGTLLHTSRSSKPISTDGTRRGGFFPLPNPMVL